MTPRLRKLALTVHVTSTVGWLGAIVGFLALAIAGSDQLDDLQNPSPVLHAGVALLALLVAVTLSVYKPRGMV